MSQTESSFEIYIPYPYTCPCSCHLIGLSCLSAWSNRWSIRQDENIDEGMELKKTQLFLHSHTLGPRGHPQILRSGCDCQHTVTSPGIHNEYIHCYQPNNVVHVCYYSFSVQKDKDEKRFLIKHLKQLLVFLLLFD
jgi:hypothetical protein